MAPLLAELYNDARQSGVTPARFQDGIVTLLYKKGYRADIRNYRPITLLNGEYKILTRILAKRLLKIITQFLSSSQIGFVPRTFIAEATMLVKMVQAYVEQEDEEAHMIFLDLEKAFDRVSWSYLKKSAIDLGFTPDLMSWIDLLYNEASPPSRKFYANGK